MSVSCNLTRARVYLYVPAFVCVSRPLKCFLITALHKETYLSRRGYVRCGSSLTTLVGRDAGQRLSVLRHNSYFGVGGESLYVSLQTDMSMSQPYELSLFLACWSPSIHSSNSTYSNMFPKKTQIVNFVGHCHTSLIRVPVLMKGRRHGKAACCVLLTKLCSVYPGSWCHIIGQGLPSTSLCQAVKNHLLAHFCLQMNDTSW